jgi:hypothetical protein
MLSMTNPLMASDIESIHQLKQGIVYDVKGFTNDRIVIKMEPQNSPESFKEHGKIINLFDPSSKAKALTQSERLELKRYCDRIVETENFYKSIGGYTASDHAKACQYISEDLASLRNYTFLKMQFQNVIDIGAAAKLYYEKGDKGLLNKIFGALSDVGGLERLGAMIASDAFNGNFDRFFWEGPDVSVKIGPFHILFKALLNPGNVMISLGKNSSTIAMLDYVDPSSQFRDFNVPLAQCEKNQRLKWPVKHLLVQKDRLSFAKKVIDDLESLANPGKRFFSMGNKLGKGGADRLAFGLYAALNEISLAVKPRTLSPQCPIGLKERYNGLSNLK